MRIAIYGGSFNPPHLGHQEAAHTVSEMLSPDLLLIIPDHDPPHKELEEGSPTAQERLRLCELNFRGIAHAQISDMEIRRSGKSYTADTIQRLREEYPEDDLFLTVGSDMFLSFEEWYRFPYLLENCTLAVVSRYEDDAEQLEAHRRYMEREYKARIKIAPHHALPMSSMEIRDLLRVRMGKEYLAEAVYREIIRCNFYDAEAELTWLRERTLPYLSEERVAHVAGCEAEAVRLARHYGEDAELAAEAAILHDITKNRNREEQLILCREYGIICDEEQLKNASLLHALTGAAFVKGHFGASKAVCQAIRWHTTGKADMSLLEKIIYLADYIEPTRDFPGVEKLRKLAYEDLDEAIILGLEMSLEELERRGISAHPDSVQALIWYKNRRNERC